MPVAAIVFDLDDTLYAEKAAKVAAECAVACRLSAIFDEPEHIALAAFLGAKKTVLARDELGPARNDRRRWIEQALVDHDVEVDGALVDDLLESYWSTMVAAVRPYADAELALPALATRASLWIATNEHGAVQQRKLERLGIREHFRGVLTADVVGAEKPDPRFFVALSSALEVPSDSVVFVGDNPRTDVAGALAAGMRVAWFRRGPYTHHVDGAVRPTWIVDYLTELIELVDADAAM